MTDSQLTTFALGIPAPGQPQPAYAYTLRLGAADPAVDSHVVYGKDGSYAAAPAPNAADPRSMPGIVLYSYDNFTVFSPKSRYVSNIKEDFSEETLTATVTNGLISNAFFSSKGLISTYASAAQMAINTGDYVTFNGGNTMAVSVGNSATTGIGSLLRSNYGLSQNIYGGQIVNIATAPANGVAMNVQGWGQAGLANTHAVSAATSITFSIDPLIVAAEGTTARRLADWLKTASLVVTGIATMVAAIEEITTGIVLDKAGAPTADNYGRIKETMIAAASVSAAASSVIVACQIAAMAAGMVASRSAGSGNGFLPSLTMTSQSIVLEADPFSYLTVDHEGISVKGGIADTISLNAGTVNISASEVSVRAEFSLTLACGASKIELTPLGIKLSGTLVQANGANIMTG